MAFSSFNDLFFRLQSDTSFLVMTVSLFVISFVLVHYALKHSLFRNSSEDKLAIIIAAVVAVLSTWYMADSEVLALAMGYAAVGTVFFGLLPLIIVTVMVHRIRLAPAIRKAVLVAFGVFFFIISRSNGTAWSTSFWVVLAATALVIISDEKLHGPLSSGSTPSTPTPSH